MFNKKDINKLKKCRKDIQNMNREQLIDLHQTILCKYSKYDIYGVCYSKKNNETLKKELNEFFDYLEGKMKNERCF